MAVISPSETDFDDDMEKGNRQVIADLESDTQALVALYASTEGEGWSEQQSWLDEAEDVAFWRGVMVRQARVVRLTLPGNLMQGPLDEIATLSALTHLILAGNELSGGLEPLEHLPLLVHVDLRSNQLGGALPMSLLMLRCAKSRKDVTKPAGVLLLNDNQPGFQLPSHLVQELQAIKMPDPGRSGRRGRSEPSASPPISVLLNGLDLSYLSLTGKLPEGLLPLLASLQQFDLGGNPGMDRSHLEEFLASEHKNLGALEEIWNPAIGLEGSLDALALLPSLTDVSLAENRLEGSLIATSALPRLVMLDLSDNRIGGGLDPLENVGGTLEVLRLRDNQLVGGLEALAALGNLREVDLLGNDLSGALDPLQALEQLQVLRLDRNDQIVGTLDAVAEMAMLEELSLDGCGLEGTLTPLRGLRSLNRLWLGRNKLVGDTSPLAGLVQLVDFSAPGNGLSGSLGVLQVLAKLESLDLRDNDIEGGISDLLDLDRLAYCKLSGNKKLDKADIELIVRRGRAAVRFNAADASAAARAVR